MKMWIDLAVAFVPAYLIGAIPFAYLVVKGLKGIDIRTVGSGNVGATNVGRVLGPKFFLLVFGLDVLKGLLPVLLLPRLIASIDGSPAPRWVAVVAALGAILGHNFPIYLRFRGGKGVATSLGAFAALDPVAGLVALVGFIASILSTRIVSISSIVGAVAYVVVHFVRAEGAWDEDLVMSLLTLTLLGLMIVRHRKNFTRILAGTEPKVSMFKSSRGGRVSVLLIAGLALVSGTLGYSLYLESTRIEILDAGAFTLKEVSRASTGYQRASRVLFFDEGRRLAVLCPRYSRVALFDVTDGGSLQARGEIGLKGRPQAIAATADRLVVVERPDSDIRHLEPGWVESFDFEGQAVGPKIPVGINPDDVALMAQGRYALVVSGERTTDDGLPPERHLAIYDMGGDSTSSVATLSLGRWEDEAARIHLSESEKAVSVALHATGRFVEIDLADPTALVLLGDPRPMAVRDLGYPSRSDDDCILMPVASPAESVLMGMEGEDGPLTLVLGTRPSESAVEIHSFREQTERVVGQLPLRGPLNIGEVKPVGVAYEPGRGLVAVAAKSGTIHMLAIESRRGGRALAQEHPSEAILRR